MDWIEPIEAIVLLLLGAATTYITQKRIEEIKAQKAELNTAQARLHEAALRLRDERRQIYLKVLEPYIAVLQALGTGVSAQEASRRLGTNEHRKAAFELKLVGTDEVVTAFNTFARYIMDAPRRSNDPPGLVLRLWADLLLAIRRNVGEPGTQLTGRDMILDWVSDIDTLFHRDGSPLVAVIPEPGADSSGRAEARHST
jgi:hypothetical protein